MTTLAEAMEGGRGSERPFRCTEHDDRHDSASLNVLKGVWYCYVCHASGMAEGKKAPSASDLAAMLEPDQVARHYPHAWLELFGHGGYWLSRFPAWLCYMNSLGTDPFTGDGTFPVYTPNGVLAGVGRRKMEGQPKYLYPPKWAAAKVLDGYYMLDGLKHVVLVEGMADRVSLTELGIPALACYGSGLHAPQLEMLLRLGCKQIVLGFDMDNAGANATARSMDYLKEVGHEPLEITWPEKDPGECTPEQRQDAVATVLGRGYDPQWTARVATWKRTYEDYESENT